MQKEAILSRLDKRNFYQTFLPSLKLNGKTEAKALCPFHDDRHPSLSVNLESGLYNCFSCGAGGDVLTFYQRYKDTDFPTALTELAHLAGMNGKPGNGKIVATYNYTDSTGEILYRKHRIEPAPDGRNKSFRFEHMKNDRWVTGRGCESVAYNLPALAKSKYVLVVEGEGKVEALREWGFTATCLDSGSQSPWLDHYLPYFEGKEKLIVLPDNDGPGRKYATRIASALYGKVGEIKIVELPGLEEKGDIVDWGKSGGTKEQLLELIKESPVWSPPEETHSKEGAGLNTLNSLNAYTDSWPVLQPEARYGLAGDVVRAIEPQSEADPVALLVNLLVSFGNVVGDGPHFTAEADRHPVRLFIICVGETSKGRKGTAWGHNKRLFNAIDPEWGKEHVFSGLSSGEGLIWAVRDHIEKTEPIREKKRITGYQTVVVDEGVSDKRLLMLEPEFASVLRVIGRDGNTLSPIIRQAWDTGNLRTVTKNSPAKATGAHVSILGHITKDELLRYLDDTEAGNGFGNRFLWLAVRRSKVLPEGGRYIDLDPLIERLSEAVELASGIGEMKRDDEARGIWKTVYPTLSEGKPGLFGALTSRSEAQVMRLACIYALLDASSIVKKEHLLTALALWDYCEASVRYIFGNATGDYVVDRITQSLEQSTEGMSRTDIYNLFGRNLKSARIGRALTSLLSSGTVRIEERTTEGARRPTELFHLTRVRI